MILYASEVVRYGTSRIPFVGRGTTLESTQVEPFDVQFGPHKLGFSIYALKAFPIVENVVLGPNWAAAFGGHPPSNVEAYLSLYFTRHLGLFLFSSALRQVFQIASLRNYIGESDQVGQMLSVSQPTMAPTFIPIAPFVPAPGALDAFVFDVYEGPEWRPVPYLLEGYLESFTLRGEVHALWKMPLAVGPVWSGGYPDRQRHRRVKPSHRRIYDRTSPRHGGRG